MSSSGTLCSGLTRCTHMHRTIPCILKNSASARRPSPVMYRSTTMAAPRPAKAPPERPAVGLKSRGVDRRIRPDACQHTILASCDTRVICLNRVPILNALWVMMQLPKRILTGIITACDHWSMPENNAILQAQRGRFTIRTCA